mmetsp:Transcript_5362/g.17269  ORF Transcript_5362/g.17269 Transcript_5362/m.17269 type:complete len:369 (-) Transcript_5362:144-1250(-)
MHQRPRQALARATVEGTLVPDAAVVEATGRPQLIDSVVVPPHLIVATAEGVVQLGQRDRVLRLVAVPSVQGLLQHRCGLLVVLLVLVDEADVPEVLLLGAPDELRCGVKVLLRLVKLPQLVVDRAQIPQRGLVRWRALGHLLQEHSALGLARLLATEGRQVLEKLDVPRQSPRHTLRLHGRVECVGFVQGVVLEVGHGEVEAGRQHLGRPEALWVGRHEGGKLGLALLEDAHVHLEAVLVVHLAPSEDLGPEDEVVPRWPQRPLRAKGRRHHQPKGEHEVLHVLLVPSLDATGKRQARLLASLGVKPGALVPHRQRAAFERLRGQQRLEAGLHLGAGGARGERRAWPTPPRWWRPAAAGQAAPYAEKA